MTLLLNSSSACWRTRRNRYVLYSRPHRTGPTDTISWPTPKRCKSHCWDSWTNMARLPSWKNCGRCCYLRRLRLGAFRLLSVVLVHGRHRIPSHANDQFLEAKKAEIQGRQSGTMRIGDMIPPGRGTAADMFDEKPRVNLIRYRVTCIADVTATIWAVRPRRIRPR